MLSPLAQRAFFITIEGIEGAGKSTAMQFVQRWLNQANIPHLLTREPGGTEISEAIRSVLLLKNYQEKMCAETELLLMFASRAQHLNSLILPALSRGEWVVSDRFTDATYAYQGGGRGIPVERIAAIEQWVQGDVRPDRVILLDISPEIGMQRIQKRSNTIDRIEQEKVSFFERARAAYLGRAKANPASYVVIDASQNLDVIESDIVGVLESLIAI